MGKNHHILTMDYEKEKKLAEARAKVIKALGHPTRIFMVQILAKESLSVNELTPGRRGGCIYGIQTSLGSEAGWYSL